jgi:glutamyl-Q tRNA(Asp) synthetase
VVVDDAAQGVTHVVRGQDLLDNTPRQIWLQHALGLAHTQWLHAPLVLNSQGEKLSKQSGAAAFDAEVPLQSLNQAATVLGLPPAPAAATLADALLLWVHAWSDVTLRSPLTI